MTKINRNMTSDKHIIKSKLVNQISQFNTFQYVNTQQIKVSCSSYHQYSIQLSVRHEHNALVVKSTPLLPLNS